MVGDAERSVCSLRELLERGGCCDFSSTTSYGLCWCACWCERSWCERCWCASCPPLRLVLFELHSLVSKRARLVGALRLVGSVV